MENEGTNEAVADAAAGVESQIPEVNPSGSDTGGDSGTSGINPAWNDLLGSMPSSLHSQIIPHLQKWDQGVQQRFATVQSQFEPYKALIEQQVNPDEVVASLKLAEMISQNPREFYDRMTQHYGAEWGLNSGQGQAPNNDADDYSLDGFDDEDEGNEPDLASNPLIKQLQEQQETIASFLAADLQRKEQEQQAQIQQQAEEELRTSIAGITEKYGTNGKLDEKFIRAALSIAVQTDSTVEEAAEQVAAIAGMNARPQAPRIMPTSGGVPLNVTNPADLSRAQTKDLAAQILKARLGQ